MQPNGAPGELFTPTDPRRDRDQDRYGEIRRILQYQDQPPLNATLHYQNYKVGTLAEKKQRRTNIKKVLAGVNDANLRDQYYRIGLLDLALEKAQLPIAASHYRRWLFGEGLKSGFEFNGEQLKYYTLDDKLLNSSKSYSYLLSETRKKARKFVESDSTEFRRAVGDAVRRSMSEEGFQLPKGDNVRKSLAGFNRINRPIQYAGKDVSSAISSIEVLNRENASEGYQPSTMEILTGAGQIWFAVDDYDPVKSSKKIPEIAGVIGSFSMYAYFTGDVFFSDSEKIYKFQATKIGTRVVDRFAFSGSEENPNQFLGYWHPDYGHMKSKVKSSLRNGMFTEFRDSFVSNYNRLSHPGSHQLVCETYALVEDMDEQAVASGTVVNLDSLNLTS